MPIPFQHLDVGQKMMGETKGLRPLKVGVTGNQGAAMTIGLSKKRALQPTKINLQIIQSTA